MKVLLTGASGFVGSHILDRLRSRGIPTAVLIRASSQKGVLEPHLDGIEVRTGSICEPETLRQATAGITHVIHCAGCVRARRHAEFYEVNQTGTRNLIEAIERNTGQMQRFVHVSSLAAAGPALPQRPACEDDPPHPVSEYGKSKLAGELEVRHYCPSDYIILRPPVVYGPRDREFLRLFRAIKHHVRPRPAIQPLSLVFVKDLAECAVESLAWPAVAGKTFFVASTEVVTARRIAEEIALQMRVWTVPLALPTAAFWPMCLAQEILARITGKANVLSLQKFAELRAPGWVCDAGRLHRETGYECRTDLSKGIAETLAWYREHNWL